MPRYLTSLCVITILLLNVNHTSADDDPQLTVVTNVARQPLVASVKRVVEALQFAGSPLDQQTIDKLNQAYAAEDHLVATKEIQKILDPLCLAEVNINPESRVKVAEGPVAKELTQQGWRAFLVKVHNEAGINPELVVESPNALPVYERGRGARQKPRTDQDLVDAAEIPDRFLDMSMLTREPMKRRLSGLPLEYRVLLLYSRDAGHREANLAFNVGAGTQDIGFRNSIPVLFNCSQAVEVTLNIRDFDGKPAMAGLTIRDRQGRVYPNPARRLAPDFFFHHQIYRADGESVLLPPGDYSVTVSRGPEYRLVTHNVTIPAGTSHSLSLDLERWIHIAKRNWYSGDHHVHAAGCAHYDSPTEGVGPEDMMRHILGEDLNVGCVLSWGPCWYTQKEFFEGRVSDLSTPENLMRYDVEVSGFPSSHAGHLCLLNLSEDDYPGTEYIEQWPSWTQPVLKWGQDQGGIVGYSHSGWGLTLPDYMPNGSRQFVRRSQEGWQGRAADKLPDYAMPPFDGIGANEYIVTTAHGVCDFISTVDTPAIWELNIWYHTLNCGMTTRISGETDFPCIYGEKVGLGRVYVKLDEGQQLNYDNWVAGLKDGRSYCGDGMSHILDFKVDDTEVGQRSADGTTASQHHLNKPQQVTVTFDAAALLEEQETDATRAIKNRRLDEKPYWHIERSRIDQTRTVPVEVIVNGEVVSTHELLADGSTKSFSIPVDIQKSSWVAVRILPSVHTNPIFVHVDGQPIRANKKSAEWCAEAVRTCWKSKVGGIREEDRQAAKQAYDQAEQIYLRIAQESP